MQQIYDTNAPKKPKNLSVNNDLLNELKAARRNKWLVENKQAIDDCNKLADTHGLFADKHRVF